LAHKAKRTRNYAKEYQARVTRGLARGKSRAQARGHARAGDVAGKTGQTRFDKSSALDQALKLMKQGMPQKKAAKTVGVSAERLRRFQKENTTAVRQGRRWIISDIRPVTMVMVTRGRMLDVTVPHDAGSDISAHWAAVNRYLDTNDASHLQPFVGKGLRDTEGVFHPYETRPNVLRKLDSIGELSFVDIYRHDAVRRRHGSCPEDDVPGTGKVARHPERKALRMGL
jgi:hypothetical protein